MDVTVLRSADCWTDYKLLRAQLWLQAPAKTAGAKTRKRYAVAAPCGENVRDEYIKSVREMLQLIESGAVRQMESGSRNVRSSFVESAIESVHQYPVRETMSEPLTEDE